MPLELRKNSKWWYGRYEVDGKRYCVNLDIEAVGKRPATARQLGDSRFENSRGAAKLALEQHVRKARSKQTAIDHLKQLYELQTGDEVGSLPLGEMFERWKRAAGRKDRSEKYVVIMGQLIRRFTGFVERTHPKTTTLSQVTPGIARDFMAAVSVDPETKKEITGRTYNSIAIMLRSVFKALAPEAGLAFNPFDSIQSRPLNTEHRRPFTLEQLTKILDVADPLVRPLIVTGMCTAMRKGDCCMLEWKDVDLEKKFIRVKTSKTGETAEIPIFERLLEELSTRRRRGRYVFPKAAALYRRNPHGITKLTKEAFASVVTETTRARECGQNSASVHDFHSLRTTWITLALTAGIPMELVRRVTGHQTVDVVLKHYFRPGREDFQKTLNAKMPALLTGGAPAEEGTPSARAIAILRTATSKTWRKCIGEAIALIASPES